MVTRNNALNTLPLSRLQQLLGTFQLSQTSPQFPAYIKHILSSHNKIELQQKQKILYDAKMAS